MSDMEKDLRAAGYAPMNEKQWRSPRCPVPGEKFGQTFALYDDAEAAHAALLAQRKAALSSRG